jgi:TRAP-type C4-dicarboxylate transport system permease small subunit
MNSNFDKMVSKISDFQMALAMTALGIIVPINLYEIIARTFFNKSLIWIQEISVLLMVWMIFCGFTKIVYEKKDIKIDLITGRLNNKIRTVLEVLTHVVMLVFLLVFSYYGYFYMMKQIGMGTLTSDIPRVLYIFPVVLNSISVTLIYINELIVDFKYFTARGEV